MQPDPLPVGTRVKTADGKDLGEIKEVQTDHYVVEKGMIFEEDFFIPRNAIISLEGDTARVGLNEADLAGAGWEEPPVYEEIDELAFQPGNVNPVTPDPFGVIATPRGDQFGANVAPPGEKPAVVDGTGNVSRVATTEDLTHPAQPVSDVSEPRTFSREVAPGEVWEDPSIAEIEPGSVDPGRVDRNVATSHEGVSPAAAAQRAGTNVPYEQRQQPYAGEPEIAFELGLPVNSADDEHVGDVVNISPHHVMVEKSRFFRDRNFSIPKTAFHDRRGDTLYLNVPAVALDTAGWDTGRFGDADVGEGVIIPVPPRNLGGTGW
jgi:hypothetical protein